MTLNHRNRVRPLRMPVLPTQGAAAPAASRAVQGTPVAERFGRVTPPRRGVPAGACDGHVHVFDPARHAYVLPRTYTPGGASVEDLTRFLGTVGLDRVVLVQPSAYGTDNRCLLDALARLGASRARGIAVVDLQTVADTELQRLAQAGVRGLRLNLEVRGERDARAASAVLRRARQVVAGSGMALQIYADIGLIEAVADDIAALEVPVLLDHFAGLRAERGLAQPGMATLLGLLRDGRVHIKLSAPYRASRQGPDYRDVAPLAQALIAAAPNQMLWGSDWPHTGSSGSRSGDLSVIEPFRPEDAGHTLDLLSDWAVDATAHRRILVDNAARLFGFAA